ncbi:hypothetical protein tb265_01670 [Gemmatimonadetes bacterium T265]|nr:hypothetical protein tb265_01670 [Gemmatimonadetes bacterium T265]
MYVGHVGIALGLRGARSAPPLWLLVVASQLPDWGDALLQLASNRTADAGWSPHGFPLVGLGALGAGLIGARITRSWRGGALAALACVSHWAADYLTGYKPTWPGGPVDVGLGWYGHATRDFLLESGIAFAGWVLWRRSLPAFAPAGPTRGQVWWDAGLAWGMLGVLFTLQFAVDVVMSHHTMGLP